MVYLKKANNNRAVMFYDKSVAEESLVDMGVPKNIAKKLADLKVKWCFDRFS